jgi:(1->4)-alpha-D-glucan 1-alpha-D-glucosylmutase
VDYSLRQRLLAEARKLGGREVWERRDEALPKIWLIRRTLNVRAKCPAFFDGTFEPLVAQGTKANHVVAFIRGGGVITIVPRFVQELKSEWREIILELPAGSWHHEFTGETFTGKMTVDEIFKNFPVALLVKTENN